ncbi:retrovirus-related Pol polyprotein from transposon 297 [Nephila pilipes]|uniref:Retrovirus-related Pol polyprotein from transposon 297 n=1 Tax=Nephila pilipes TaxID=299642 RepID=A0A8X6Q8G3_NEPPI|nr:retrovirus-related Pol polyprotein from transposon 297 [Nephila pilipes]
MESQFILAGITIETTKFHHVISALQPEELDIVGDIILNPPSEKPYTTLRCRLSSQYADSEEQRIRDLISGMQLGDGKPSRLLLGTRSKAEKRMTEELLKSLFLQRFLTLVQQILAISNDQLEKLAEMADGIVAFAGHTSSIHAIDAENQELKTMLMDISSRMSHLETHERFTSRGSESQSASRNSGHQGQCWYHRYCKQRIRYEVHKVGFLPGGKLERPSLGSPEDSTDAFEKCKNDLAEATVLYHPAADALLTIGVDASNTAVGAAIHQQAAKGWQPLVFFSKTLSAAQRRYSANDRELLEAYMAIKHFSHVVEARNFILFTDLKPLIYKFKQKEGKCSPPQLRQLDLIGQFTTDIRYLKELENVVADALSRIHISTITTPCAVDFKKMAKE